MRCSNCLDREAAVRGVVWGSRGDYTLYLCDDCIWDVVVDEVLEL